ncbi:2-oxo-hepta-3-ene-1,7-dioate hydratase, partial [Burkholderia multivorans]
MLDETVIAGIPDDLAAAERPREKIGLLTAAHPDMTVEDSYAVQ